MKMNRLTCLAMLLLCMPAFAAPVQIQIQRQKPGNLFDVDQPVTFNATANLPAGTGEATAVMTDFDGQAKTLSIPLSSTGKGPTSFTIEPGKLEPGYYDLKVTLKLQDAAGKETLGDSTVYVTRQEGPDKKIQDTDPFSFGVVRFVNRTASESRHGGYRFGLKLFQIGDPGVWWRRTIVYDVNELLDATRKLGLQWTRHSLDAGPTTQPGVVSVLDLIGKHQMNVVLKVEGFPESCYDAARYGPLEEWKKKYPKKIFGRCTVPAKAPYQAWLREKVAAIPPEQNIYEMGNEVWDLMSGAEFAEWCQMSVEVIKQVNPNAKVGFDPGGSGGRLIEWSKAFFAAGGAKNMDIIYSHPYSFTPLPEWRTRPLVRNLQDYVADNMNGQRLPIYVTEYGWPTAAKDTRKHSVSETVQAERTTRQSIMMYAEDVKTLIPHWLADREQDITERENWFGFYRLSGQPKPVLIAHANCARLIDGGRFVGDLWQGNGLASMLFEKDGTFTLAMWTAEGSKEATVDLGVSEVKVVDLIGREQIVATQGGKLTRTFNTSVVYFVGVSSELAKHVSPPTAELNADLWSVRPDAVTAPRASAITIDGKLDEWKGESFKLAGDAAIGAVDAFLRWDDTHVYVAMNVTDKQANKPGTISIGLSGMPGRQQTTPGQYDCVLSLTPAPDRATAKLTRLDPGLAEKPVEQENGKSVRWAVQSTEGGCTVEVAIAIASLKSFPSIKPGVDVTCRVAYEKGKSALANSDAAARFWPHVKFVD